MPIDEQLLVLFRSLFLPPTPFLLPPRFRVINPFFVFACQLPEKKGAAPQLTSSSPEVESELDQMKKDMGGGGGQ